jgi:membrane carboxypeptidase/penicillin-binding protein PbpC
MSVVTLGGLLLWALWSYALNRAVEALPQPLFDRPYATLLLSAEGELLGARVAEDGQWRFPSPAEAKLPERYRRALLSYEDKRFDRHALDAGDQARPP